VNRDGGPIRQGKGRPTACPAASSKTVQRLFKSVIAARRGKDVAGRLAFALTGDGAGVVFLI